MFPFLLFHTDSITMDGLEGNELCRETPGGKGQMSGTIGFRLVRVLEAKLNKV